jgi:hypothetical protein
MKELFRRLLVIIIGYLVVAIPGVLLSLLEKLISSGKYPLIFPILLGACHRGPFAIFLLEPGTAESAPCYPWLWLTIVPITNIICILAYLIYPNKCTAAVSFFGIVAWFSVGFLFGFLIVIPMLD